MRNDRKDPVLTLRSVFPYPLGLEVVGAFSQTRGPSTWHGGEHKDSRARLWKVRTAEVPVPPTTQQGSPVRARGPRSRAEGVGPLVDVDVDASVEGVGGVGHVPPGQDGLVSLVAGQVHRVLEGRRGPRAVVLEVGDAVTVDEVLPVGGRVRRGDRPREGQGRADLGDLPTVVVVVELLEAAVATGAAHQALGTLDALRLPLDTATFDDACGALGLTAHGVGDVTVGTGNTRGHQDEGECGGGGNSRHGTDSVTDLHVRGSFFGSRTRVGS